MLHIIVTMPTLPEKLWNDLTVHKESVGGRLCLISGMQGSGKSTLMIHILLDYLKQGDYCIWRARERECIHMLPNWQELCRFYFHRDDEHQVYDVRGKTAIPITSDLKITTYKDATDLLSKLSQDEVNVVFEPSRFTFSGNTKLLEVVEESGKRVTSKIRSQPQKPTYFWFEVLYLLKTKKDTFWYSLFIDECDEVLPEHPASLDWHLQHWCKDSAKDLRKSRVSLICSTHAINDVFFKLISKFTHFIYCRNAQIPKKSLIRNKQLCYKLRIGQAVIESGLFGWLNFKKLPKPDMGDLVIEVKRRDKELEQVDRKDWVKSELIEENIDYVKDDSESIFRDEYPEVIERFGG